MAANMPQAAKVRTRVDCVFLCITDSFVDIDSSSLNDCTAMRPFCCPGVLRKKTPDHKTRGFVHTQKICFFSHPDYTVGIGIRAHARHRFIHPKVVADYTAGGDLHPAPKNSCIGFCENCLTNLHKTYYIGLWRIVNIKLLLFCFFGR